MDKEYLEILLRTKKNDMQVTKIISLEYTPAVDKGENYMSTMLRYKLVVLLVSGETAVKHLIVKSLPKSENHCAFVKEFSYFKNEIYVSKKFFLLRIYLFYILIPLEIKISCSKLLNNILETLEMKLNREVEENASEREKSNLKMLFSKLVRIECPRLYFK